MGTSEFWSPIQLSLQVAAWSTLLVVVLGTLLGKLLARRRFRGRMLVETLFLLPMVMPPTVAGFGLLMLLGQEGVGRFFLPGEGMLFTKGAAVIASAVVSFPLMFQAAKVGFASIDPELELVARSLGANSWQTLRYVQLPLAKRSLLAGVLLSFARGLGEFGATLMIAGNIPGRTQTIPLAIYNAVESGQTNRAWGLVICLFLLSFVMMAVIQQLQRQDATNHAR
ncbi:molybdate ABC transporter permease subunit [Tumebacillus permanentifrigoris]|uniref:Molybdenum transport system permease n=1 Tax=Tumebacillus permanentifrigoris TaxID=378543 RepID=A0A316D932_9BACL|nr:molybdate ABC transporter permease subunit [Tumebacillus permanentifrigoris]PWK11595.1 molybdate transport system permease protein [Tumebacillus permanentifrigoris]